MRGNVCFKCGKAPFYYRPYSGEYLCEKCFLRSIREKVRKTLSKYGMLKYGEKIGVAVSGGKDSLVLLRILAELSKNKGSTLVAITIDEGILGYREEALRFARGLSEQLGIPHRVYGFKDLFGYTMDEVVKMKGDISSCAACGIFRRRALDIAADKEEVDVLATAHNLDDIIQTFFINVFNGDLKRISWISPVSQPSRAFKLKRIHPMSEIYEKEISLYALLEGIPLQSVNCPYMEEGIRSEVRLYLNSMEEKHPGIKYNIYYTALRIAERLDFPVEARKCDVCGFPSIGKICQVCQLLSKIEGQTFK
jgi:uncharacterized protein (TIGR00269 family)